MTTKVEAFLILFLFLITSFSISYSQNEDLEPIENVNQSTMGIELGTGQFQHLTLSLLNFENQVIASSDEMIPTQIKANFNYGITSNFFIRFSSGYSFCQQTNREENDLGRIDTLDMVTKHKSAFHLYGFPSDATLLFKTKVDNQEKFGIYFGLGAGYYIYNLQAEGYFKQTDSKTNQTEEYLNPEMTLSGWAQFFVLGFTIDVYKNLGATFEVSKIGLSSMKVDQDILKQQIYNEKIVNQIKYGYKAQNYSSKSGFDEATVSVGVFWKL
jgi:hypothetical protein